MQPAARISPEVYFALDAESPDRNEYWDGMVVAMAGAEPDHNQVVVNLTLELGQRLRDQECRMAVGDQRVQIDVGYVYPDLVVICGPPEYLDTRPRTLTNPELLVEVLSASTMETDLEAKLLAYTCLESLREYWIVSAVRPLVMQYARRGSEWVLHAAVGLDATVQSPHFGLEVPLREIYRLVGVDAG